MLFRNALILFLLYDHFSGAGYIPVLPQSVEFQRWKHLFKSRHNEDMSHKLGNVDISHLVTSFLLER